MNKRILLCTDLDRTLLPNGTQPESPLARRRFNQLIQHSHIDTAYVTGRHRELVRDAINQYKIPTPDYVIADVGSSIYEINNNNWQMWNAWQEEIALDWGKQKHADLVRLLAQFNVLRLQELEKQNTYKLSYYAPQNVDIDNLRTAMELCLTQHNISASLIWSIDELTHTGLLDVLPKRATKLHAIEFLMKHKNYDHEFTIFAGDSGNDLPVLSSHLQSVLVANARDDVRAQALSQATKNESRKSLYLAQGEFLGMNGNYAAGILEGVVHFIPQALDWINGDKENLNSLI